jgi:serine O-acetyltransferase
MSFKENLDGDWAQFCKLSGQAPMIRTWRSMLGPRALPVFLVRIAAALERRGNRRLSKLASALNVFLFGLEVPPKLDIAPGLVLPHPQGTILGARRIGRNALIYQQVTLGAREADFAYKPELRPDIGDNVVISAGAKVLGGVRIGNNCVIGANAVVLSDVPEGCRAVGVPARILPPREVAQDGVTCP